ncbi:hypothetical protein ACFSC6_20450 [Rufibacter sediminis]|uniref:Uncharacterized protein n=1 Tax=Rufibacter sediminis TaxID=2762756 RepID=A0ABR6VPH3_9BACT|nr:hypothetical protein [Rufibacter sediminis]MBC3538822.1 hypothetical protein [Rufibacter sediminis]
METDRDKTSGIILLSRAQQWMEDEALRLHPIFERTSLVAQASLWFNSTALFGLTALPDIWSKS